MVINAQKNIIMHSTNSAKQANMNKEMKND